MNPATDVTLVEERQALCRQLLAQRALIAHRLGPVSELSDGFPRSMTVRFLIQHPDFAVRLMGRVATLLKSK